MESFKYAKSNLGVPEEEAARRVDEMKALFGPETEAAEAAAFCREKGIDYVVYSAPVSYTHLDVYKRQEEAYAEVMARLLG